MRRRCPVMLLAVLFLLPVGTLIAQSAPVISSISYDPVAPGALDCIHGSGFGATQGTSQLLINGTAVNVPWSDTSLCPTIASTTPLGTATAQVVTSTGSSNVLNFTVVTAPSTSGISPGSGLAGTQVTLTGTNFGVQSSSNDAAVVMNNNITLPIVSWSDTQVVTTIPSTTAQGPIFLQIQSHGVLSNLKNFTVISVPTIASISPTSGAVGTQITITGSGFGATQGTSQVQIGTQSLNVNRWRPRGGCRPYHYRGLCYGDGKWFPPEHSC